jgi:hypothetical protein
MQISNRFVKTYEKYNGQDNVMITTNVDGESSSKIKKLEHQIAVAVGCYIISDHTELLKGGYVSYRGEKVVEIFCDFVIKAEEDFAKYLKLIYLYK